MAFTGRAAMCVMTKRSTNACGNKNVKYRKCNNNTARFTATGNRLTTLSGGGGDILLMTKNKTKKDSKTNKTKNNTGRDNAANKGKYNAGKRNTAIDKPKGTCFDKSFKGKKSGSN